MRKLKFKVGDTVWFKDVKVIIVSRYVIDKDTPYRIKFPDGRQIQVPEHSLKELK